MRMELGLSQHQTIKQIQTLSPQMYMSMEILCLNSMDLEDRIETELENNETLEVVEPVRDEGGLGAESAERTDGVEAAGESFDARVEQWDQYSREEFASARRTSSYSGERDDKLEALSNTEGRPVSLQEHLEGQLHLLEDDELVELSRVELLGEGGVKVVGSPQSADPDSASEPSGDAAGCLTPAEIEQVRDLGVDVIYNIDNRGYLLYSLEEIATALDPPPPIALVRRALNVVQNLDPPGVGGRDLKECLLLQLRRDSQSYPVEERIVQEYLEDLGHNRLPKISRGVGVSIETVKEAAETIATLNPLPGKPFGGETARVIKPDVVVDEVEGSYVVRVESEYLPRLRISPHYFSLYRESRKDPEVRKYLRKKMDGAEWLMGAIRQRQSTLQRIAEEVVQIQSGFLDYGVSQLKPLKMVEVAERVGVHVSTISRAINDKYMQTPRGIYPMKFFFTGGATKSDGTVESRESVIQRIKDLIANEDKDSPLSDVDIARKLAEYNIKISRRTVTKYREAESIASSRERKIY